MEIIAYDREGSPTVDATQLGEESGETIVDEPPGTYYLDLVTIGDAVYKVTVEQCEEKRPETNQNTTPNASFSQQHGDDHSSQRVRQVSQRNQYTSAPGSRPGSCLTASGDLPAGPAHRTPTTSQMTNSMTSLMTSSSNFRRRVARRKGPSP